MVDGIFRYLKFICSTNVRTKHKELMEVKNNNSNNMEYLFIWIYFNFIIGETILIQVNMETSTTFIEFRWVNAVFSNFVIILCETRESHVGY
jgi:pheromone shutdown protein TraB